MSLRQTELVTTATGTTNVVIWNTAEMALFASRCIRGRVVRLRPVEKTVRALERSLARLPLSVHVSSEELASKSCVCDIVMVDMRS